MGETDEKEIVPAETPTTNDVDEPKETEKLLSPVSKKVEIEPHTNGVKSDDEEKPSDESKKTNGEEIINIPDSSQEEEQVREVKSRKLPLGGIKKIPEFFKRNKSKHSTDGAEGELLENAGNEAKADEEQQKAEDGAAVTTNDDEKAPAPSKLAFLSNISIPKPNIKLSNPFAKKTPPEAKPEETTDEAENKEETGEPETEKLEASEKSAEAEGKSPAAAPIENAAPRRCILSNIRLPPLASIIPKRLRPASRPTDDVEMGNGPNNKAGLASMETLDDSIKDIEANKDEIDKAAIADDDLETVKLNDTDREKGNDKAAEAAAEAAANADKRPLLERITKYRLSVDDVAIIGGILTFLLLVIIIVYFIFYGQTALKAAPLRDGKFVDAVTSCGNVEGVLEDSAFAFRGIPYAVPPVGENRWRPAQVINNIDYCWNGTLKAHNSTPVCWQSYADGTVDGSEDCLHLDVITPHVRYEGKLPVVVLIGAESLSGGSPTVLRPSARTARARDVIFVRPNFRLGVFGFLALNTLSESTHPPVSGNYALSDIVAALKWIQLNIIHFGGNPNAVTLLGHRAGGTLVAALAASPEAKHLFARAWVASGAASFPGKPLAESERANNDFLNTTNCKNADCLRALEDEDVLDAVPDSWKRTVTKLPDNNANAHEWLVLDGQILQKHAIDVWKSESGPVRLVIGATAHESHSQKLFEEQKEWTPEIVRKYIQESKLGQLGLTDEILKRYNATYQGLVSIISDIRTICPLLTINKQQPSIPFYVVTQPGGEKNIADVDADVQAILGRYEPKTPEQRRYVSAIQQLFYHYISHGEIKQRIFNIGQDALPVEDYPNCSFWISKDIVPRYARLD